MIITKKSILYQLIFLLVFPVVCQSKIKINITVASYIKNVITEFQGEDNKVVTDHEKELYNITLENLNRGMRVELGKAPDNLFLKDPTPYGDLYKRYKWPEVKRNLKVVNAEIVDLIRKEGVLKTHEHVNNSTEAVKKIRSLYDFVESSVYSSWSKTGLPAEETFYDVNVNFGDTKFVYENEWRDRTLKSTLVKIGVTKKGRITVKPGQTVVTKLKAFKTIITIKLKYKAQLIGNLIGDYERLYGKYHFYSPNINNIMGAAGLTNDIETTESLEVVCYSDPSLHVYDRDTGLTVRSDTVLWLFRSKKRNKSP
ncbi:unnamed protein product [Chilo suppressalis]|uniref:Uncharacterized protein n=1 Tax=Chilo suppressalis TaxID=168631 RepID=A0ABN8B556_CHISP|nr:unnamed protein product [Chilo suppressalis]